MFPFQGKGNTSYALPAATSKQTKRIAKRARKMSNRREKLQPANKLFADQEAEAHITILGIIDICAEMEEVGTTTHDEWYGNFQPRPTYDTWYDHVDSPQALASEEKTKQGVMDGSIPSAVVDTVATSNVGKYGCGLKLTGKPSSKVFTVVTGQHAHATEEVTMDHDLRDPACTFDMVPDVTLDCLASTRKIVRRGVFHGIRRRGGSNPRRQDDEDRNLQAARPQRVARHHIHPEDNPTRQASPRPRRWPRDQSSAGDPPNDVASKKLQLTYCSCPQQDYSQQIQTKDDAGGDPLSSRRSRIY